MTMIMRNIAGFLRTLTAQSISEYVVLLTLVTVGLVAMQTFVRRGLSARYKDTVDFATHYSGTNFTTAQYEPFYAHANTTTTQKGSRREEMAEGGWIWTKEYTNATMNMTEFIGNVE